MIQIYSEICRGLSLQTGAFATNIRILFLMFQEFITNVLMDSCTLANLPLPSTQQNIFDDGNLHSALSCLGEETVGHKN